MSVQQAYDNWASQYDSNDNKTRDLEAIALRETLSPFNFENCLEIGCGTGKNTVWLMQQSKSVTAVDLSDEMMVKAKNKIGSSNVSFKQADITKPWDFGEETYDLVSFSLMLEHIEHLEPIFRETAKALKRGGYVYVGELHPFKQYAGSKARFETEQGVQVVDCYSHHLSDFTQAVGQHGLSIVSVNEYFDNNDRQALPRLLVLLLKKN
jgi:ubiquinone/menaquinone biosynthesis C-methylase UbiE